MVVLVDNVGEAVKHPDSKMQLARQCIDGRLRAWLLSSRGANKAIFDAGDASDQRLKQERWTKERIVLMQCALYISNKAERVAGDAITSFLEDVGQTGSSSAQSGLKLHQTLLQTQSP